MIMKEMSTLAGIVLLKNIAKSFLLRMESSLACNRRKKKLICPMKYSQILIYGAIKITMIMKEMSTLAGIVLLKNIAKSFLLRMESSLACNRRKKKLICPMKYSQILIKRAIIITKLLTKISQAINKICLQINNKCSKKNARWLIRKKKKNN